MSRLASSILAISLVGACHKGDDGAKKPPAAPPIQVQVVDATVASTPDVITLTGLIAADQRAEVTADTQGKVINVMVERGQRVKLGDPVVQLDVRNAALSQREAQANLSAARAQKQLAEQECARTKSLFDKGAITRSEFDRQNTQCTSALDSVAAAQARTEMMAKSVSDGLVRAPFDGMVAERSISPGEWVNPGKPLFTLVKDDPLKVELSVPEVAVPLVKDGADVDVLVVATGHPVHAKVTRVGAEIGRTRSLIVEAQLDKAEGVKPGMFAEAHVVTGHTDRVVLPATAIATRGNRKHVFVVKNGEVEDRIVAVTPVPPAEGKIAIANNVDKGEKVVGKVTDDKGKLRDDLVDGARVTP